MALDFPLNPQVGDIYTEGNRTWTWNGRYWKATSTTIGYTGSRGRGFNFVGRLSTESLLPLPYSGEESDVYLIEDTGVLWIWDGSSWGPVGQFTGYTGSRGAPGASVRLLGSVATEQDLPQNPESGDGYIVQALGDLFVWNGTVWTNVGKITGETGPIGYTGSKGDIGFTGSQGFTGSRGIDGNFGGVTLDYTFSASTDSSLDPGVGKIKFNDRVLTSASLMYIGDADDNSVNLDNYLATIDASTSELKGHFRISRKGFPEQFVIFAVTGTTQNQGSYFIISCSYVSGGLSDSSTAFDDGDDILITFARTGDKGDTGFTGSQGLQGFTGSQGATGTSVRIVGSLADQSLLPTPYGGEIGDGYLIEDTGHLWLWNGTTWNDIGKLTGEVGPTGFTGSKGLGIIDTELVDDELIIIYDDSTQNNLGNIRGFVGSRGESSFFWGSEPPLNPEVGARWFYTTEGLLLVYTDDGDSQQWVEVAATGFLGQQGYTGSAGLSGVRIQTVTYPGQATAADTQGGETLGIVGGGFNAGIKVYVDSTECAATLVDQNNLTFVSAAKTTGSYDIVVYNTDGSSGIKPNGIVYSGSPVWDTQTSLPEQNIDSAISIILSATSNSSVTYFLQQGSSLPVGLSMSSSGVITGTVTGLAEDTTYSFTVVAIDAESQTTPRTFSLIIRNVVTASYLVIAGGGSGGHAHGGGGGAGGYRESTSVITLDTNYTVTIGAGAAGATNRGRGNNGSNSVFGSISATGGGGGGSQVGASEGIAGGSGGGGGNATSGTKAGGQGNAGGYSPVEGYSGGSAAAGSAWVSAGGGGSAEAGFPSSGSTPGNGGSGRSSSITGTSVFRAGGGGGCGEDNGTGGLGGAGGGTNGSGGTSGSTSAAANTGGGSGGTRDQPGTGLTPSGAGGSGVVIIKYPNYLTIINSDAGLTFSTATDVPGFKVTTFTAGTGNIKFYQTSQILPVEYLVVAGGGAGSCNANGGAGGGAGGYRTDTGVNIIRSTAYTVTVGAGGTGSTGAGTSGGDSVFSTITSAGGGGGPVSANGTAGGSGSGAPASGAGYSGGAGNTPLVSPSQGNNGGNNNTAAPYPGGGGGGAGFPGASGSGSQSGAGGDGLSSSITGTATTYAGGGGGGGTSQGAAGGAGGAGGGGAGGGGNASGTAGTANTGGGSGGGGNSGGMLVANGGSGVVIIAYPDTYPAITTISGGLAYDQPTRAGYRVYRFTAGTGNITF